MRLAVLGAVWCLWACPPILSQSTQGIITGRVQDIRTGGGIENAAVICTKLETAEPRRARSDPNGNYVLTLLSPGTYYCRSQSDENSPNTAYQPRESYSLELPVAGRLDIDFPLRPLSDVYDKGLLAEGFSGDTGVIVHVFAADVRTTRAAPLKVSQAQTGALEATVSQVFGPTQIQDLPLAGRDVYTLLITQPGVTSDAGTARSLGLSASGQRPSASNFLLDGLENNNSLVTGPLTLLNPEAVQEYRVSTSMYAAEFGRTAGYLANAITRSGTTAWHGVGYFNIRNEVLNANDFQRNAAPQPLPRTPLKQVNPGFSIGGPITKRKLFASGSWDYTRFRSFGDPVNLRLPTSAFHPVEGSTAETLLRLYPAPTVTSASPSAVVSLAPSFSLNRNLALARIDYNPGSGGHRLTLRTASNRQDRPDFAWTPYTQFNMQLLQRSLSTAFTWTFASASGISQELRAGWNSSEIRFDRPHAEVPTLQSADGTILPGSPALYGFRNRARDLELVENIAIVKGRHLPKFGAGVLVHHVLGYLTLGRDRIYGFPNLEAFGADRTSLFYVSLPRENAPAVSTSNLPLPDYNRTYKQRQMYLFAQDSYRLTSRVVVNFGMRYENFGAPRNTAVTQNAQLLLGSGSTFVERLQNAGIDYPRGASLQQYDPDNRNWAARFGISWSPREDARTVLRGGYGIFYDRPFDNEWQNLRNNSVVLASARYAPQKTNYVPPAPGIVLDVPATPQVDSNFSRLTFYQPGIRNPYTQNYFLTLQQQLAGNTALSVGGFGSLGSLITTDVLNRDYFPDDPGPLDFYRADLPAIYYRANQGASTAYGLTVSANWRASRAQFHIAWTWSHSIDNQSEPLAGDYYNLDFVGIVPAQTIRAAAFTRQFDSSADRGNSDFDQRHNLVFFSIWNLPPLFQTSKPSILFRDWKVSQLAAVRSGLPFTVLAHAPGDLLIFNNRANIVDPRNVAADQPKQAGRLLLNPSAFAPPDFHQLGGSGRNAFRAPGFFNVDLSLSRSFPLRALGEAGRAVLRADAFNFLNHANLGTPDPVLSSSGFGVATYGRQGVTTGFPAAIPFQETARQIQLMLRIEF